MKRTIICFFLLVLLLCGGRRISLEWAGESYRAKHDYQSLEWIYKSLMRGQKRSFLEGLLGEPDYSPIDGLYYYSSDRSDYLEDRTVYPGRVPVGLIVDYRDGEKGYILTETLQEFQLRPIGE